jgi:hypothetical protein
MSRIYYRQGRYGKSDPGVKRILADLDRLRAGVRTFYENILHMGSRGGGKQNENNCSIGDYRGNITPFNSTTELVSANGGPVIVDFNSPGGSVYDGLLHPPDDCRISWALTGRIVPLAASMAGAVSHGMRPKHRF